MIHDIHPQTLAKLPLAHAVLRTLRYLFDEQSLNQLYDKHRGQCYERCLSFSGFVHLITNALLGSQRSVRETLVESDQHGQLPCTIRAFYDKLSRMPTSVSSRLVDLAGTRLAAISPAPEPLPFGPLRQAQIVIIDGKVIKHVPRRLRETRRHQPTAAKLLGGRGLVAIDGGRGLALALEALEDGEANELTCLPQLLAHLPPANTQRIFVADRAFGYFQSARLFAQHHDFLLRKHGSASFQADPTQPVVTTQDRYGRTVRQTQGKLYRKSNGRDFLRVRCIDVERASGTLTLITNLLNEAQAPADDLLEIYLHRWDIEGVFQQVTQLFDLRKLIGSTPQANVFQLAIVLVMATVIQTIQSWIATAQKCPVKSVSTEMLLRDVRRQLESVSILIDLRQLERGVVNMPAESLRGWLAQILSGVWRLKYKKREGPRKNPSQPSQPRVPPPKHPKLHDSVYRILQRAGK